MTCHNARRYSTLFCSSPEDWKVTSQNASQDGEMIEDDEFADFEKHDNARNPASSRLQLRHSLYIMIVRLIYRDGWIDGYG